MVDRAVYVNNNSISKKATDKLNKFVAEKLEVLARVKNTNLNSQQVKPQQIFFPFWPEAVRAVPNTVLRSALFGICKIRQTCKKQTLIVSTLDCEIRFKGERFNQTDLDVFEELLNLAMRRPLGCPVEFGLSAFLTSLGRNTGSSQKVKLREELRRLMDGVVEIKWIKEQKLFQGTLIKKNFIDTTANKCIVVFDLDLIKLFDLGHSYIDHQQRLQLGQHNLAKWLHGFYSSHAKPYAYKIETIQNLCGCTAQTKEFRRLLVPSFKKLIDIGLIQSWRIESATDLLHVNKIPTKTQRKHLEMLKKKNSYPQKRPI